jgi:hypothetical protein
MPGDGGGAEGFDRFGFGLRPIFLETVFGTAPFSGVARARPVAIRSRYYKKSERLEPGGGGEAWPFRIRKNC